ncbi:MAG: patatin-like phospholipase family protein [Burkholderiaceae bacterium]|jgi:NTE family protein
MTRKKAGPGRAAKASTRARAPKSINLALQGGGAHGAFTWGVLDALLDDGRIDFEGISATSAGSLNAVVLAHGLREGKADRAREALHDFWRSVAEAARPSLVFGPWFASWMRDVPLAHSPLYWAFETMTRALSPYQFNPLAINPLRGLIEAAVDFEQLRAQTAAQLYLCATNVETGKIRLFERSEVSVDAVLASACLPQLFQAVEIDGQYFWDGGYMGNPAIFPLIYDCQSADVLIVHVNPIVRQGLPKTASDIANRVNEISFNSSLMREMRAIAFVTHLIESGKIGEDEMKLMRIHSIRADALMARYGVASKSDPEWGFLCELRDAGRTEAQAWVERHFDAIGKHSTVDIRVEFL